jgi:hypothetical protein
VITLQQDLPSRLFVPGMPLEHTAASDADGMSLPIGSSCADCTWCVRCEQLFANSPSSRVCGFIPSAFTPAP